MRQDNDRRIQILEEKFEYQEQTIDALNEVIIEQQAQINVLEEHFNRLQELLAAGQEAPAGGQEPRPPHY